MICLGLYTSFYAGLSTLVESDLKKLVALSTLRHLGFITTALFSGSIYLAYLHLISHAIFKSLLFMCVGEFITLYQHIQDSRYISSASSTSLFSSSLIVYSLFGLIGLPFVRGYYSKDYVLEISNYSGFGSFIILLMYLNVFFTFYYTIIIYKSI